MACWVRKRQPEPGKTRAVRVSCRASVGSASVIRNNVLSTLSFPRSRSNLGTVAMFIIGESGFDQRRSSQRLRGMQCSLGSDASSSQSELAAHASPRSMWCRYAHGEWCLHNYIRPPPSPPGSRHRPLKNLRSPTMHWRCRASNLPDTGCPARGRA
jgi:hypothetical protein